MSGQNWRTEVDATDYFGHQQKRLNLEQRRPVVRRASDLVGPGIGGSAIRITDFNDVLATFNGYYSADIGALNAPSPDEPFVGTTVGDAALGGHQTFTGLSTGFEFTRTFIRNVSDPSSLLWGSWRGAERVPASATATLGTDTVVPLQGFTQLKAPPIETIGVPGTYISQDVDIFVTRPGVYTGWMRVTNDTSLNLINVTAQWPDRDTSRIVSFGPVPSGHALIPFTFWSTGESQEIRVSVDHDNPADQLVRWRDFTITRTGDID